MISCHYKLVSSHCQIGRCLAFYFFAISDIITNSEFNKKIKLKSERCAFQTFYAKHFISTTSVWIKATSRPNSTSFLASKCALLAGTRSLPKMHSAGYLFLLLQSKTFGLNKNVIAIVTRNYLSGFNGFYCFFFSVLNF